VQAAAVPASLSIGKARYIVTTFISSFCIALRSGHIGRKHHVFPWLIFLFLGCLSCLPFSMKGRFLEPNARDSQTGDLRPSAGVELELTPNASLFKLIVTENDKVGDLLAALPQDVLGSAGTRLSESGLNPEDQFSALELLKKIEIIGRLAGLRAKYHFHQAGGRQIPALRLADSFDMGQRNGRQALPEGLVGLGLVVGSQLKLTSLFRREIEYGNEESATGNLNLVELHAQSESLPKAGDLYAITTQVALLLDLKIRSQHVHAVAPHPDLILSSSRMNEIKQLVIPVSGKLLEAFRLAEFFRRLNLWMDMYSFVESNFSIRRNPPHYDLLTAKQYSGLLSYMVNGPGDAKMSRVFGSVAFQFPGKYSEPELAGLEFRGFWKTQDAATIKRRQDILNRLHDQFFSRDYAVDGKNLRAWLLAQRQASQRTSDNSYLARQAHGLRRAEARSLAAAKGWTNVETWISGMSEQEFNDKAGITLVLHDWKNDPWFAHDNQLQSSISIQLELALKKLPESERHFEIVRDFLVDSGLYAAVLQSLRLPAQE
jgi:hypothetical protein